MTQIMTMQEIEQQFDSEWVLIDKPETDEAQQALRGKVVFHSKDREEIHRKIMATEGLLDIAVLYIGEPPEGTIFLI